MTVFLLRECSGSPHFAGQSGPRHTNETSIRYTIRFRLLFAPRWIAQKRNWWRFHIFRLLETKSKNPMQQNCFKSSRRWASWGVVNLPRWSKLQLHLTRKILGKFGMKKLPTIWAMAVSKNARLWWPSSRSWRMLKEPSGHDTVDGSEICQSPIEVGSLATSMCNFLYVQAVVVWDFWPINSTWGRDSLDTFHWFYWKAHLDTFQFVEKAVVLFICPF